MKRIHLHHNPLNITRQFQKLLDTKKISQPPIWFKALQLHPPSGDHHLGSVIPSEVGQFSNQDENKKRFIVQSARAKKIARNSIPCLRHHARALTRVPKIVYPEDEIRRIFYRDHPFELLRPRILLENEDELGKIVWTDIFGGEALVPLSGER